MATFGNKSSKAATNACRTLSTPSDVPSSPANSFTMSNKFITKLKIQYSSNSYDIKSISIYTDKYTCLVPI